MSSLELSALSNDLIKTALNESIEQLLKTTKYDTSIEPASKKGDNFVGIVYRVTCERTETDENAKHSSDPLKLILKVAPQHQMRRDAFPSRQLFLREIYLFNEVLRDFRAFEESRGLIFEEDGFHEYPTCYNTVDVAPVESLVLEDLCVHDFVMVDVRNDDLTADHVNLVMRALGKYHAISFALKDQQPDQFRQLAGSLDELFIRANDENMAKVMTMFSKQVLAVADSLDDKRIGDKVKAAYDGNYIQLMADMVDGTKAEPYTIICHGDCWNNNTMFQLDEAGKPVALRLLDFQVSRYASPALDILYYIFCCTQKQLRDRHYDSFLVEYHASLSKHLKRLGSDPEKVYPHSAMLEQFRNFGRFGLYMASMLVPMLTADASAAPDLDAISEEMHKNKEINNNMFKSEGSEERMAKRLSDVIYDMDRLGYI